MTLIQSYQAFTNWLNSQPAVNVLVKAPITAIRKNYLRASSRLLAELTIDARTINRIGAPAVVHSIEHRMNQWKLIAGGNYQKVKPGIYDLFNTTELTVSPVLAD